MNMTAGNEQLYTLNLDRIIQTDLKTNEDLKRHSIDLNLILKPIEKSVHIFGVGEEIQKLVVIENIPTLLKEDSQGCLQKIIPKMQQSLPDASTEIHVSSSYTVKTIMEKRLIPTDMFIQTFLQTILTGINHRDSVVADAWVDCLLEIIPFLPWPLLSIEIQPIAIDKASFDKSINARIASAKLLGALCKKYPGVDLNRELLPTMLQLCQDLNKDVRATICRQLPYAIRNINHEVTRHNIFPILVDLASDEADKVKETAYTAIVDVIPYLTPDMIKTVILPVLQRLSAYAFKFDENVLLAVAATYGKMVISLERVIASSEKENYLKTYISLSERGLLITKKGGMNIKRTDFGTNKRLLSEKLADCRKFCAYNYPAMARFAIEDKNKTLLDLLHPVLCDLAIDSCYIVRRTISCSLHEVVDIYGKYVNLIKPELIKLLKDDVEEVLDGFVSNLAQIIVKLIKGGVFKEEQTDIHGGKDFVRALLKCELTLSNSYNWRLYTQFINQLGILWYVFPPDIVYNSFITLFFARISTKRQVPVRQALIRTILLNSRYIPRPQMFIDIRNKIFFDFADSNNFYDRMMYIRSCEILMDIFSSSFFKEHFFARTLKMAGDAVANIRWGVCKLLPKMNLMLKVQGDEKLYKSFQTILELLANDQDNEVSSLMKNVKLEFLKPDTKFFSLDKKKIEEEKKISGFEERIKNRFPSSITKILEPALPQHIAHVGENCQRTTAEIPTSNLAISTTQSSIEQRSSTQSLNSDLHQGSFTDEDFLVDAGVALPLNKLEISKISKLPVYNSAVERVNGNIPKINVSLTSDKSEYTHGKDSQNNSPKLTRWEFHPVSPKRNGHKFTKGIIVRDSLKKEEYHHLERKQWSRPEVHSPNHRHNTKTHHIIKANVVLTDNVSDVTFNDRTYGCSVHERLTPKMNNDKAEHNANINLITSSNDLSDSNSLIHSPTSTASIGDIKAEANLGVKIEQNGKTSPRKSQLFKPSIPVRKRSIGLDTNSFKRNDEPEKRHSVEVMDMNKNISANNVNEIKSNTNASISNTDTVQRRKKSQLPRPLSCVVLPSRNAGSDKTNSSSRLPVMRR